MNETTLQDVVNQLAAMNTENAIQTDILDDLTAAVEKLAEGVSKSADIATDTARNDRRDRLKDITLGVDRKRGSDKNKTDEPRTIFDTFAAAAQSLAIGAALFAGAALAVDYFTNFTGHNREMIEEGARRFRGIFGSFEAMGSTFATIGRSFNQLAAMIAGFVRGIFRSSTLMQSVGNSLSGLGRTIGTIISPLRGVISDITRPITNIFRTLSRMAKSLNSVFVWIDGLVGMWTGFGARLDTTSISTVLQSIVPAIVQAIQHGIRNVFRGLGLTFQGMGNILEHVIDDYIGGLLNNILPGWLGEAADEAVSQYGRLLGTIGRGLGGVFHRMADFINDYDNFRGLTYLTRMGVALSNALRGLGNSRLVVGIQQIGRIIRGVGVSIGNMVTALRPMRGLNRAISPLTRTLPSIARFLLGPIQGMLSIARPLLAIGRMFARVSGVLTVVMAVIDGIRGAIDGWRNSVGRSMPRRILEALWGAGHAILRGFTEIPRVVGNLIMTIFGDNFITRGISSFLSGMSDALGLIISLPQRLFFGIWDGITHVMNNGIGSAVAAIGDAVSEFWDNTVSWIGDTISGLWNWVRGGNDNERRARAELRSARNNSEEAEDALHNRRVTRSSARNNSEEAEDALHNRRVTSATRTANTTADSYERASTTVRQGGSTNIAVGGTRTTVVHANTASTTISAPMMPTHRPPVYYA